MITYNGVDLSSKVTVLDVRRPLLAPQLLSTLSIEGKHGSFFYKKTSDSIPIEIDIVIKGVDRADLRNKIREFADLIDADEPKPLIIHDEPDKYINAIISGDSGLDNVFRLGQGTITMFAPDPFYYAIEDDVFEYTTTGVKNFTRKGNTESYPIIEIEGTANGGEITLNTDNSSITFDGTLRNGERLVLDSELLTAYVLQTDGTKRSAVPDLDTLDFPVLVKGANSVSVTTTTNATVSRYKITCNSRWK